MSTRRLARLVGPSLAAPVTSTMTQMVERAASSSSGLTLIDAHENETFLSYAALLEHARDRAGALAALGVRPHDRVALVLPTGIDFLTLFFGIQLAGAVPVPLYPPVRLGRLGEYAANTARMLDAVGATLVVTDAKISWLLGDALGQTRTAPRCLTVAELPTGERAEVARVAADDLGLIQFSSGSTSQPKPVALTHGNLMAQVTSIVQGLELDPATDVGVSWLPLYHDMGLIGGLGVAVSQGAPLSLMGPEVFLARPALWLRALSRCRGTVSPAPNFAYGLCLKRVRDEELEGVDLSRWRIALNGAEPVSLDTCRAFTERFSAFGFRQSAMRPVYGLAESTLAVTFSPPRPEPLVKTVDATALATTGLVLEGTRPLVAVGAAVPGAEVEIRSDAGEVLPEGAVGRVLTRGPSVMREYFERATATEAALRDGWLDTGDLGFVDSGELYLVGRTKDLVIIRGANHAPQTFEEHAGTVLGVRAGCLVALGVVPDGTSDEHLVMLVERSDDAPAELAEAVADAVLAGTGIRPHTVVVLEPGTLPRTSSGKLRRAEARARFLSSTLAAPDRVSTLVLGTAMARSALGHLSARVKRTWARSETP